ncbi:hypothetical protein LCGC14_1987130 [marine sediment metagenome]|uniref:Uncharacterized protein n=1 Tax=marine sediment metagenome TaxID=412755 RepID=A0A0F9F715_9ZZZZ
MGNQRIHTVPKGMHCLMGWYRPEHGCFGSLGGGDWGCFCNRPEGHDNRHQCVCGSWRKRQPDDPQWDERLMRALAEENSDE